MSRRKYLEDRDPIWDWMGTLRLKDLKRACILRGLSFIMLAEMDVHQLQSWLYSNFETSTDSRRLGEYDLWRDKTLIEAGYIDEPIHIDLKLDFYKVDGDGNEKSERRDPNLLGVNKSVHEIASFVPVKGSKKTLAYDLTYQGLPTKEIIDKVLDEYPDVSEGSIKVWCSQARKIMKARDQLK